MNFVKDLVSVILPSYNRYDHLVHAIKSCLCQTYPHVEIIVIDDASTDPRYIDGSLEKFPRTTIVRLPVNQRKKYNTLAAQGMTRQEGIELARGEWIAFLDDDDWFHSTKLEKQLAALKSHSLHFCSTNMFRVHHLTPPTPTQIHYREDGPYFYPGSLPLHFSKELIQGRNYINNSSVLLHRSVIDKTGSFEPIPYEDWEYWKRAMKVTNELVLYLEEPLVYYTISTEYERQKDYIYVTE